MKKSKDVLRGIYLDDVPLYSNPVEWLKIWIDEAEAAEIPDPNAMVLVTVDNLGKPGARVVLLKEIINEDLVFYTNYTSRKAHDLMVSDKVAIVFHWRDLDRQIRVEGVASLLSRELSDKYFDSRPEGSKIGAWASPQSKSIPNRAYIETIRNNFEKEFEGKQVPRPSYWGGYRIYIENIEFWKGREDRLHDRIQFFRASYGWNYRRLAP